MKFRFVTNGIGSCVTEQSSSCIDGFAIQEAIDDLVECCEFSSLVAPRPHRVVRLITVAKPNNVTVEAIKETSRLPVRPPNGPRAPTTPWTNDQTNLINTHLNQVTELQADPLFYSKLDSTDQKTGETAIGSAYEVIISKSREELACVLGVSAVPVTTGGSYRIVKIKVLNTFRAKEGGVNVISKALRWAQGRLTQLSKAMFRYANASPGKMQDKALRELVILCDHTCPKRRSMTSPFSFYHLDICSFWHNKIKRVIGCFRGIIAHAGMFRPSAQLYRAAIASCQSLAIQAASAAEQAEKEYQSQNQDRWQVFSMSALTAIVR